jgi:hypothetical protein
MAEVWHVLDWAKRRHACSVGAQRCTVDLIFPAMVVHTHRCQTCQPWSALFRRETKPCLQQRSMRKLLGVARANTSVGGIPTTTTMLRISVHGDP